jgi:glutathione S-transferase
MRALFRPRREQQQQEAAYELVYFDTRGAAEPIRLLLSVIGVPWGDLRYPMGVAANGFALSEAYIEDRDAGSFRCNMNTLPVLRVLPSDGKGHPKLELGQSHAIARYLAARHGLMGEGPLEAASIDSIYECVRDVKSAWFRVKATPAGPDQSSQARRDAKERWFQSELAEWVVKLEAAVCAVAGHEAPHPWLVGSKVSLADIATYHLLGTPTETMSGNTVSFFDGERDRVRAAYVGQCPRLAASVSAVSALPRIRSWEEQRPDTFS